MTQGQISLLLSILHHANFVASDCPKTVSSLENLSTLLGVQDEEQFDLTATRPLKNPRVAANGDVVNTYQQLVKVSYLNPEFGIARAKSDPVLMDLLSQTQQKAGPGRYKEFVDCALYATPFKYSQLMSFVHAGVEYVLGDILHLYHADPNLKLYCRLESLFYEKVGDPTRMDAQPPLMMRVSKFLGRLVSGSVQYKHCSAVLSTISPNQVVGKVHLSMFP